MNAFLWLLAVTAVLVLRSLRRSLQSRRELLPRDFDFTTYKNRELNQRGLFDKTKWP